MARGAGGGVVEACCPEGIASIDVADADAGVVLLGGSGLVGAEEPAGEEVQWTHGAAPEIGVGDVGGVVGEVPVVQGQVGVDLPEQFLEAVGELAVPGQELRAAVHVGGLVDLVLLEPPADPAGRAFGLGPRVVPVVQLQDRRTQSGAFGGIDILDVASYSVSHGHDRLLRDRPNWPRSGRPWAVRVMSEQMPTPQMRMHSPSRYLLRDGGPRSLVVGDGAPSSRTLDGCRPARTSAIQRIAEAWTSSRCPGLARSSAWATGSSSRTTICGKWSWSGTGRGAAPR